MLLLQCVGLNKEGERRGESGKDMHVENFILSIFFLDVYVLQVECYSATVLH